MTETYQLKHTGEQIDELLTELSALTSGGSTSLTVRTKSSGYISPEGYINSNSAYIITEPVYLNEGDKVTYKVLCTSSIAVVARVTGSADRPYDPLVMGINDYVFQDFIAPASGYYAFSSRNPETYPDYAFQGTVTKGGISQRVNQLETQVASLSKGGQDVLAGKKYVACGDSFTAYTNATFAEGKYMGNCKTYPFLIGERTGMEVVNMAVSGMSMVKGSDDNFFSGGYYKTIPADADYITIKLGINDVNYGAPIGSINDSSNATFYGAWNVVMDYLVRNYPSAKIGIIVTNGASLQIMGAERAIAKKWGVPYLDYADPQTPVMGRMVGLRSDVSSTVLQLRNEQFCISSSDTHPNASAHAFESSFIEAFLRRL